jgi:glucokinase
MSKRGAIGIDIGGTKSLFALFDEKFNVVEEIKLKTNADKGKKVFSEALTGAVEALVDKAHKSGLVLAGAGAGVAGSIDYQEGKIICCPNVPFLDDYPFKARLAKLTGAHAYVVNDVQAGLYGEYHLGAAKDAKHVIGVFIGTGIGGALIINGKLHVGATGHAGDIGNYLLHAIGPLAGSQREGVLDDVASRTAIAGDAAIMAVKQWAPNLLKNAGTDVSKIKSGDIAEAIKAGDTAIEELVRSRARIVGIALSNLVDFINPDRVVLGGGLVEAMPELLREEIKAGIEKHSSPAAFKGLKVVVASLENHAVTTGAAKLAIDMLLSAAPIGDDVPAKA